MSEEDLDMIEATRVSPLTAFLFARIAEDEAEASGLADRYPSCRDEMGWRRNDDAVVIFVGVGRALAEYDAKRAIIEGHEVVLGPDVRHEEDVCFECGSLAPCLTMRALATVYSDHPDYRQEWRPDE